MVKRLISYPKKIKKYVRFKLRPDPGNGEFANRIRTRHKKFWIEPAAEVIRSNTTSNMSASDPLEKWHNGELWQRKLENKYNSREFAKMFNYKVPELYWRGSDVNTINFTTLPKQFVIRPTMGHSSKGIFLMDQGISLTERRAYSNKELKEALTAQLNENADLEFLIEEFVKTEDGKYEIPNDYKFYTFNGEIAVIQINGRFDNLTKCHVCYDAHWNKIPNAIFFIRECAQQQPPKCLGEMIKQVKVLSKAYEIFVRIDFYATDKGPVFGEFSATPSKGNFFSPSADRMFTWYWDRFCEGML